MVGQTPHCRGTGEIIICGGRQEPRISYKGIIASLSRAIFNWPSPKLRGTWREETRERQSVKSGSWKRENQRAITSGAGLHMSRGRKRGGTEGHFTPHISASQETQHVTSTEGNVWN